MAVATLSEKYQLLKDALVDHGDTIKANYDTARAAWIEAGAPTTGPIAEQLNLYADHFKATFGPYVEALGDSLKDETVNAPAEPDPWP